MIYKYNTEEKNDKLYITGWTSEKGKSDNIKTFAEPCNMEKLWQFILEKQPDGTKRKVFDPLPETSPEMVELRRQEINQKIQFELPNILRIIALDDTKQFRDLKIEIKKIIDSIEQET